MSLALAPQTIATSVRYGAWGTPDLLEVVRADVPTPGPGEVRIAVAAAGLTFADVTARLWAAAEESERRGMPTRIEALDPNAANVRVFNLLDLDEVFLRLIDHPTAAALAAGVLGDGYIVSNFTANIARPGSGSMMIHSDQGTQYTSREWAAFLREHRLGHSMSRRGNCHDDAVAESFFQLLKREKIRRRTYRMREAARTDVFEYIEQFYNSKRKHTNNGMLSPIGFETRQRKLKKQVSR